MTRDRRNLQQRMAGRVQLKVLVRMRERVVRDQRRNVAELRTFRAKKFPARRHIEEEVAYRDRGSLRQARFFYAQDLASGDLDYAASGIWAAIRLRRRLQPQPGNRSDRRQRLATKAKG